MLQTRARAQRIKIALTTDGRAVEVIEDYEISELEAQFYRASKTDLYTIYLSDRTRYSYRDRISDLYTKICVEIRWKMYKYKSDL